MLAPYVRSNQTAFSSHELHRFADLIANRATLRLATNSAPTREIAMIPTEPRHIRRAAVIVATPAHGAKGEPWYLAGDNGVP